MKCFMTFLMLVAAFGAEAAEKAAGSKERSSAATHRRINSPSRTAMFPASCPR